jgi:hypothetical protein
MATPFPDQGTHSRSGHLVGKKPSSTGAAPHPGTDNPAARAGARLQHGKPAARAMMGGDNVRHTKSVPARWTQISSATAPVPQPFSYVFSAMRTPPGRVHRLDLSGPAWPL